MSFLVLSLSFLPCADAAGHKSHNDQASREQTSGDDGHEDACSPFCTCTCCANLSFLNRPGGMRPADPSFTSFYSAAAAGKLPDLSFGFWQPPRLRSC